MKKSCGLLAVCWLILACAYAGVAWWRTQEIVPALVIGVLGGTFAGILISGVVGIGQGLKDRAAVLRAQKGMPRQDGKLEAASGPIRPLGAPLEAPFSGNPCVAYEYDVKNPGAGRSDFAGMALAPCAIDSPAGPAKLLGWTDLKDFAGGTKPIDPERAANYLRTAAFEPLSLGNALSTVGGLLADDDGSIRKDLRIEGAAVDLAGKTLTEKVVPANQLVTALGVWSAAKGGFATAGRVGVRLLPIGPEWAAEHVVKSSRRTLLTAVFFFIALHAILVPMYRLSPGPPKRDRAGRVIPPNPSVWDERDCDRLKDLLAAGADPNENGVGGRTPLMNAVSNGKVECVQRLVAAGARPDTADEDGSSAMSWAITAEREDLVAILKKAGGKDFRVTAETGRALAAGDEPVRAVVAYLAALQAGDLDALGRVSAPSTPEFIRKNNVLSVWQHSRPSEPEFVSGVGNENAATLEVRGTTAVSRGGMITFHYHLLKKADGWHVDKEWFRD